MIRGTTGVGHPSPTLLVLSASVGAGHNRAAEAIQETARLLFPGLGVDHRDTLDFVDPAFRAFYQKSYLTLVNRMPEAWGYFYSLSDRKRGKSRFVRLSQLLDRLEHRSLAAFVRRARPAAIVCTHFLPMNMLLSGARARPIPIWTVLTDFDAHYFWINPKATGYFVGNDEVRWQLHRKGIPLDRIRVTGIPVHPAFSTVGKAKSAREEKTVLVLSGGLGVGEIESIVKTLLQMPERFTLVAIAGRNPRLLRGLEKLIPDAPRPLRVFGFVTNMEEHLAAANLVVTKAGGLTTNECLVTGTPMVIFAPIPGQEERNCDYLLEHGAALKAKDLATLEYKIAQILSDQALYEWLRESALRLARPHAARQILEVVCGAPPALA